LGRPPAARSKRSTTSFDGAGGGYGAARKDASAESVDGAARRVIDDAGYGEFFIHRTGHGIGLDGHEHPYL